ncbi:SHOCT domain-containing protein [Ferriphaselus sp. R-1]|uniref:SHOCT domain-containing protein n=1 Tax=Ferriphaselus sp. R-1 TaxID=1485544 RepID=UPI001268F9AF|nr:SHOCT domain-containing protein [Ferriphaselus sp. R-1]
MGLYIRIFIISLMLIPSSANAWFFFFLPSSVTNKISDAITSAEGENCVGSNAKIGDAIRLSTGAVGIIKSLSGTSVRCAQPEYPIRASLDFSAPAFTSKAHIDLPEGWKPTSITEQQKRNGWMLMADNASSNSGLAFGAIRRESVSDMKKLAEDYRQGSISAIAEAQYSEIEQISVNGLKAWRYEVTGKNKFGAGVSGKKFTYLTTLIEGGEEVILVRSWTVTSGYEKQKVSFILLAESIQGITPPGIEESKVPSHGITEQTPVVLPHVVSEYPNQAIQESSQPKQILPQKESAATRLKELKALYKEGLISQKDFEVKKQDILKSM